MLNKTTVFILQFVIGDTVKPPTKGHSLEVNVKKCPTRKGVPLRLEMYSVCMWQEAAYERCPYVDVHLYLNRL